MKPQKVVIVGAGINGLVAANYLARAGFEVTLIERADHVGGACVSATAEVDGIRADYAHGASVLGLMQDFVWRDTGLEGRLQAFAPTHPKLIHFPGHAEPVWIYREADRLDREFADRFGERGDAAAFRADEARVVAFLQEGYRRARPPSLDDARAALGPQLAKLWISGSARQLLEHYFTSEAVRVYMAMTVTESGPVGLAEPYSAFTIPMMDSGSVFGGYYGFVRGGIWQVTAELGRINSELGVEVFLGSSVAGVDAAASQLWWTAGGRQHSLGFDHLLLATDPVTAARLVGDAGLVARTQGQRLLGSAGKLNLMFRKPVRWRHGSELPDSDTAFRFIFGPDTLAGFEEAAAQVATGSIDYAPGYLQIYCEGAAMRHMQLGEPFDRLAVFFNFLALDQPGEALTGVHRRVRETVLGHIANPEDCAWSRLLSPYDLQQTFGFPGGNLDHTMLVGGQTYFDRNYADDPATRFYQLGSLENVMLCGAGTYPCGSVAGTPGYMCARQLIRQQPG